MVQVSSRVAERVENSSKILVAKRVYPDSYNASMYTE
jgi:hypothetical protein